MRVSQTMSQVRYSQSLVRATARCMMLRLPPFVRLQVVNAIDRTGGKTED